MSSSAASASAAAASGSSAAAAAAAAASSSAMSYGDVGHSVVRNPSCGEEEVCEYVCDQALEGKTIIQRYVKNVSIRHKVIEQDFTNVNHSTERICTAPAQRVCGAPPSCIGGRQGYQKAHYAGVSASAAASASASSGYVAPSYASYNKYPIQSQQSQPIHWQTMPPQQ